MIEIFDALPRKFDKLINIRIEIFSRAKRKFRGSGARDAIYRNDSPFLTITFNYATRLITIVALS